MEFILAEILAIIIFVLGIYLGYSIRRSNNIVEVKNPVGEIKEKVETHKLTEKQNKQLEAIQTTLDNIDSYDGTGLGQKEIPYEQEEDDLWT